MPATARPTVAFDVTPLLGVRTGVGNAVAETYAALQGLDAAPALVPYTLSLRARRMRQDVPSDTRFVPLPARGLLKAWARASTPRIDRWITPARVVHATNYLAPATKHPTLVSVYDCSFVRYPELCTPEVLAFVPILRRAIARGATVHTNSEFVATEIEEAFGARRADGKLVVVPLGVPALGTESEMPPVLREQLDGAPFVLAVGMFEPRKNFPHLVGAFGALAASHPDLRLVIVGPDGPARPSVESAVQRLPTAVQARVLLPGAVSNAARRALLDAAAVLAHPSIYEGFGLPVLEAMTAGVPVVASRAGAVPEVAGDAALLVDATDEAQLAARIEQVLTDAETRRELVARGRDRVRRFSWQETAQGLASVYRKLAAAGS